VPFFYRAVAFAQIYKREKGGCDRPNIPDRARVAYSAADLFCLDREEEKAESPDPVAELASAITQTAKETVPQITPAEVEKDLRL